MLERQLEEGNQVNTPLGFLLLENAAGETLKITIVAENPDPSQNILSIESPFIKSLQGKKEGMKVEYRGERYRIKKRVAFA
ncbi:MAG: GreA/GreB family elongation factor [bacterium]